VVSEVSPNRSQNTVPSPAKAKRLSYLLTGSSAILSDAAESIVHEGTTTQSIRVGKPEPKG